MRIGYPLRCSRLTSADSFGREKNSLSRSPKLCFMIFAE